jgi:hypothetical protein
MAINQKVVNLWTARVIPAILIGVASYGSFAVVGPLTGKYTEDGLWIERVFLSKMLT